MRGLIIYKPRFSGASKRRGAYLLGRESCNDHIRFVSLFIYISAKKETSKKNAIQRAYMLGSDKRKQIDFESCFVTTCW